MGKDILIKKMAKEIEKLQATIDSALARIEEDEQHEQIHHDLESILIKALLEGDGND